MGVNHSVGILDSIIKEDMVNQVSKFPLERVLSLSTSILEESGDQIESESLDVMEA